MMIYTRWPYRVFCWIGWHEYTAALLRSHKKKGRGNTPLRWGPWICSVCKKTRGPFRWEKDTA